MTRPFSALQELGDATRLSVFLAILGLRKNVSQIVAELGLAQPQVSYHLRKLKDAGLAVEEKDGRWVWYQANWEVGDRNLRDFIELMARWAEDAGVLQSDGQATTDEEPGAEPALVGIQPVKRRSSGAGAMRSSSGGGRRRKVRPQEGRKGPRADDAGPTRWPPHRPGSDRTTRRAAAVPRGPS